MFYKPLSQYCTDLLTLQELIALKCHLIENKMCICEDISYHLEDDADV